MLFGALINHLKGRGSPDAGPAGGGARAASRLQQQFSRKRFDSNMELSFELTVNEDIRFTHDLIHLIINELLNHTAK